MFKIYPLSKPTLVPTLGKRMRHLFVTALVGVVVMGCGAIERASVSITPIETVLAQPDSENHVHVRGTVTNRVAIFGNGLYEVEDGTGRVWVLTENEVPALNSTVTVRGTSDGAIQLGGRHFGVTLRETRRL